MGRASRLVGMKLNIGVYVIDTEVVLKMGVFLLLRYTATPWLQVVICIYGYQVPYLT